MKWCLALDASFSRVDRPTFRALKALDFYGLGGPKVFKDLSQHIGFILLPRMNLT